MFDLLQSLSSTTSESDGSDSDDELPESMQPVCMQRNSKQNAVIGEFTPRLAQCKLPGIDSPTSESAPSEEVSPQLLTKKPSKNNDIVRWLDFDPKHLESEPASLPVDRYLECETWSGKPVVVPSEYARRISSTLELAQVLQRRPRAEVIEDFVGTGDDDLSVGAGEVIYLLFECDSTYFMAMNKGLTRGRVPKSVLNVLVAP
uniref:Sorbin n=1 Tax=Echinococcus granulosus TaxID=6210 RepID=A0A068WUD7_ECHGR|nr:sorbin [Echinococcus granulosus]